MGFPFGGLNVECLMGADAWARLSWGAAGAVRGKQVWG